MRCLRLSKRSFAIRTHFRHFLFRNRQPSAIPRSCAAPTSRPRKTPRRDAKTGRPEREAPRRRAQTRRPDQETSRHPPSTSRLDRKTSGHPSKATRPDREASRHPSETPRPTARHLDTDRRRRVPIARRLDTRPRRLVAIARRVGSLARRHPFACPRRAVSRGRLVVFFGRRAQLRPGVVNAARHASRASRRVRGGRRALAVRADEEVVEAIEARVQPTLEFSKRSFVVRSTLSRRVFVVL